MANTNRKARKAAGEKFVRVPKVGTPVQERSWFAKLLPSLNPMNPVPRRRSEKARRRALADRGIAWDEEVES